MNPWFRLYHAVLDDPKVQRLPDKLFKAWINLLCLASRNGGTVPLAGDVGFALRVSEGEAAKVVATLVAAQLIDAEAGTFRIHNWDKHQFQSDRSGAERSRRFRTRQRDASRNVSRNAAATAPESEQSRAEQNRIQMLTHLARNATSREIRMELGKMSSTSRVGNLATQIAATLRPAGSTPSASLPTCAPGPRTRRLPSAASAMPVPSGRAGAVAMPIALPEAVQAALGNPDRVDLALRDCLPPRLKSSLSTRYATTHRGNDDDHRPLGFELTRPLDPADAAAVLGWLDALDRRPGRAELVQEVARCLAVTVARERDQADLKAMLAVLAEELAQFPADVLRAELRAWARREKWWPTLAELSDRCGRAMRVRSSLRSLCERAVAA